MNSIAMKETKLFISEMDENERIVTRWNEIFHLILLNAVPFCSQSLDVVHTCKL